MYLCTTEKYYFSLDIAVTYLYLFSFTLVLYKANCTVDNKPGLSDNFVLSFLFVRFKTSLKGLYSGLYKHTFLCMN